MLREELGEFEGAARDHEVITVVLRRLLLFVIGEMIGFASRMVLGPQVATDELEFMAVEGDVVLLLAQVALELQFGVLLGHYRGP